MRRGVAHFAARGLLYLCLVLFACIVSHPVDVQANSDQPRFALLIANSDYAGTQDDLGQQPAQDVDVLAATLHALKFDVTVRRDQTRSQLNSELDAFRTKLRARGSIGFFYYAGHGAASADGHNYLIPTDAPSVAKAQLAQGTALGELMQSFAALEERRAILVVIDACRTVSTSQKALATIHASEGPNGMDARDLLLAFASAPGTPAANSGAYARSLAKHLKTHGLPVEAAFDRVRREVFKGSSQIPATDSRLVGDELCLAGCQTIAQELLELGYNAGASGLAQALTAADGRALELFGAAELPASVAAEALRVRVSSDEPTTAQRFFAATRGAGQSAALSWLQNALAPPIHLDPLLRIPHTKGKEEALINSALRAGNVKAVTLLLQAGADPNGYQDLRDWAVSDPRFLLPYVTLFRSQELGLSEKEQLIRAMVSSGVIVPAVPTVPAGGGYGPLVGELKMFQDQLQQVLGWRLQTTPDLCRDPQAICRGTSDLARRWCRSLKKLPRSFGQFVGVPRDEALVPPFVVRYFLGADTNAAYFLVEELSYYSGYALLEVDHELQQLRLLRFTVIRPYNAGGCIDDTDGVGMCWREIELRRDKDGKAYRSDYGPLPIASDCGAAEAQSRARAVAVGPRVYQHPDAKVQACVRDILKTPSRQLLDEATSFDFLSKTTLDARGCVLAKAKNDLLVFSGALRRPSYVEEQAQSCCERISGFRRRP
jgi:uncharacterized caspase-like protein